MQLKLMKHQQEFCADYKTPYLALIGGYGCGKSFSFCVKTVIMAGLNAGYEGAIAEPTNYLTRTLLVPYMEETLVRMKIPYDYVKSEQIFHMHFREGTTKVYCLSGENYQRLVGYNLAFFGSDETDTSGHEIAHEMWNKAISRVRTGPHRQVYSASTPEGYKFLYDFYVTKVLEDPSLAPTRRTIHASSYDNPKLDPAYLDSMKSQYTEAQFKVWALGEFGNLHTSLVYNNFDRKLNGTDLTVSSVSRAEPLHIGMDFNIDNMAAVVHIIKDNLPYAVDEFVGLRDVPALIAAIKQKYPTRQIFVYPDASGKNRNATGMETAHAMLRAAGFVLKVNPSNPPVGDRINSVNAMFLNAQGQRRYRVNTIHCPTLATNLERQGWIKGEPDKSNNVDHVLDAMGYVIHYLYPITGRPTLRTR